MRNLQSAMLSPLLSLSFSSMAQAQPERAGEWEWHRSWTWGFGHMFLGGVMSLVFWGLVVSLLVIGIRRLLCSGQRSAPKPTSTALEILRERFARGEIDQAEFEERKRVLGD
jgi:putative membrane protein